MALRHGQCLAPRQDGEDGEPQRLQRGAQKRLVPRAADAVEREPAEAQARPVVAKTPHQRRHGLRLLGAVHHEEDRQAEHVGKVRRRARAVRRPVEEAHHALHHQRLASRLGEIADQGGAHGIGVEIDRRASGGGGVEGRVDIVRPRLGRRDRQPPPPRPAQEREGDKRLAAARLGRSDEKTGAKRSVHGGGAFRTDAPRL